MSQINWKSRHRSLSTLVLLLQIRNLVRSRVRHWRTGVSRIEQSRGEEIANSISHGVGLVAALVGTGFLIAAAVRQGHPMTIAALAVFATAMILVYLTSTVYHALPRNRAKEVFRVLDHLAIYLLIAGTYTPFTLLVMRGTWGWTLLGLAWGFALVGVLFKLSARFRFPILSTVIYLVMGWMSVIAIQPLWEVMSAWGLFWLAAGGLAYTLGIPFFAASRLRYAHFVWHLFVLVGTGCHFVAVWQSVI